MSTNTTRQGRPFRLETAIPPPLLFAATAGAMIVVATNLPSSGLQGWGTGLLGLAFFALAGVFGPPAIARFRRAGTTIDPIAVSQASTLVTTGVYGLSRNPMYVSMTALLCALAAFYAQPLLTIGPVAFALYIQRFQIEPEERALTARFGAAYEAYRARVRRWI